MKKSFFGLLVVFLFSFGICQAGEFKVTPPWNERDDSDSSWIPKEAKILTESEASLLRFSVIQIKGDLVEFSIPAFPIFTRKPAENFVWHVSEASYMKFLSTPKYSKEGWAPPRDLKVDVYNNGKAEGGYVQGGFNLPEHGIYWVRIGVPCDGPCSIISEVDSFVRGRGNRNYLGYEFVVNADNMKWQHIPLSYPKFP